MVKNLQLNEAPSLTPSCSLPHTSHMRTPYPSTPFPPTQLLMQQLTGALLGRVGPARLACCADNADAVRGFAG